MCGRYAIAGPSPADLRTRFALGDDVELRRRYNVAPTDAVPAVTTSREGEARGELLRWGLVPHWAKDLRVGTGAPLINARSETVAEKPAFRDAFARRRCLVVADGFYEWERREGGPGRKRAHHITRPDRAPFAFAGLWATWRDGASEDPDDDQVRSCTIVTTAANGSMAPLHDRMPVILAPDMEDAWLDPATPAEVLQELMRPLPDEAIAVRRVGPAVNSVRNDGPECLEPPDDGDDAGAVEVQTLF